MDCQALDNFYRQVNPQITYNTTDCCQSQGIQCRNQSIVAIDWFDTKANGTLETLSLPQLESLELQSNRLSGNLPTLQTPNLKILRLDRNGLSGPIPAQWQILSLSELSLSDNLISGQIPSFLGQMPLKRLDLSNNRLDGFIPPDLGNLSLVQVFLHQNNLSGNLPFEWKSLDIEMGCMRGIIPHYCCNIPQNICPLSNSSYPKNCGTFCDPDPTSALGNVTSSNSLVYILSVCLLFVLLLVGICVWKFIGFRSQMDKQEREPINRN